MNCKDCKRFNTYNNYCFKWSCKVSEENQAKACDCFELQEKSCSTCEYENNGVCALCNAKIPPTITVCELWEDIVPF